MTILINHEVEINAIMEITQKAEFLDRTYTILAEVQTIKEKIYGEQHPDLAYFLYLSKIMEKQEMIPMAQLLL